MGRNLVPRLIDFGEATHPKAINLNPGRTVPYCAPEAMKPSKDLAFTREYGRRADLYSFGVLMYEIITNDLPLDFKYVS